MTFSSAATVFEAIGAARSVDLAAYALVPNAPVVRALETASDRGAAVHVVLQGAPLGADGAVPAVARNAAVAADLRRHGIAVRLTAPDDEAVHLKAAVVDGRAYLCDRNWAQDEREIVVAVSDPVEEDMVRSAIRDGRSSSDGTFSTDKSDALRLEAQAVSDSTGDRIDVETESFGATVVSTALATRMRNGAHVRLLVCRDDLAGKGRGAARERAALAALASLGAEIALTHGTEKFCVAGSSSWVGSANQTYAVAPTLDFGVRSSDAASASELEKRFERTWHEAKPFLVA